MAALESSCGFERNDSYEPPANQPFVFLEVRGELGRVVSRGVLPAVGQVRLGEGRFSEWSDLLVAMRYAEAAAGMIGLSPVPYRHVD